MHAGWSVYSRLATPRERAEEDMLLPPSLSLGRIAFMPITSASDEFEYRPHILIVDDDAAARLSIAASLHRDDYRVSFSCNGQEVKDRVAGINPVVIICDLVMDGV